MQYLFTRSQSARILAVERMTENEGRKTLGVDGAGEYARVNSRSEEGRSLGDCPQKKAEGSRRCGCGGIVPSRHLRNAISEELRPESEEEEAETGAP